MSALRTRLLTSSLAAALVMSLIVLTGSAAAAEGSAGQRYVSAAAPAATSGPVRPRGRWLVDRYGRVVLLHGVNTVDKDAPYLSPGEATTLTEADAAALARHGFNTVRLGVEFDGLMPSRGDINHAYIERIAETVEMLGEHGIFVLLDNHQDGLSEVWGGNGFPPWVIHTRPFPLEPNPGFPLYYLMPSMTLAWDEVWNNTYHALDYLGDALAALAERLGDSPAVLGIELINEPWPGTAWPSCLPPSGCPEFDAKLTAVYEKLTARIRRADPDMPVYWEPHALWNQTAPSYLSSDTENVVFSFHDYCSFSEAAIYLGLPEELRAACPLQRRRTYANYDAVAARTGWPALVTEFGGTSDPSVVSATMSYVDERFLGWQYWHYTSGEDIFSGELGEVLVRTYPQATAGIPVEMHYDSDTGAFRYTYEPKQLGVPTVIFVATDRYPDGYTVRVSGGHTVASPEGNTVRVVADGSGRVTVEIVRVS